MTCHVLDRAFLDRVLAEPRLAGVLNLLVIYDAFAGPMFREASPEWLANENETAATAPPPPDALVPPDPPPVASIPVFTPPASSPPPDVPPAPPTPPVAQGGTP